MNIQIGTRVRYTGRDFEVGGLRHGQEGVVNQLYPFVGIDTGDGHVTAAGSFGPWLLTVEVAEVSE
jgi:hypothetical protein